jgi:hypothetical protein
VANTLSRHGKASFYHGDTHELDFAPIAHMVNPRAVWRDTLHALLATYVHRPGID